jgi:microsomal prostaglandin-E synthase 2
LDYYGYSYDIVEVNSITKKQLDWSSYKKVPQIAIQIPSANNPEQYDEQIIVNIFIYLKLNICSSKLF